MVSLSLRWVPTHLLSSRPRCWQSFVVVLAVIVCASAQYPQQSSIVLRLDPLALTPGTIGAWNDVSVRVEVGVVQRCGLFVGSLLLLLSAGQWFSSCNEQ